MKWRPFNNPLGNNVNKNESYSHPLLCPPQGTPSWLDFYREGIRRTGLRHDTTWRSREPGEAPRCVHSCMSAPPGNPTPRPGELPRWTAVSPTLVKERIEAQKALYKYMINLLFLNFFRLYIIVTPVSFVTIRVSVVKVRKSATGPHLGQQPSPE